MDPNSRNQIWSLWEFVVTPGRQIARPFQTVQANVAKFARKEFGSASQMHVSYRASGQWVLKVRSEGHPVHDPRLVDIMRVRWEQFLTLGFGFGTTVTLQQAKLEAGSRDDGKPAEQLIIIPPIQLGV